MRPALDEIDARRALVVMGAALLVQAALPARGRAAPVPTVEDDSAVLCGRLFSSTGIEPRRLRLGPRLLRFWESGPTQPTGPEGAGETVLFVHGYLGDLCDFGPLLPEVAKRHRVVAFDLPGFGESTSDGPPDSIDTYIRLVAELVTRLELGRVDLVCHSMGGQVCIGVGLTSPSFVRSLTLIDAAGVYEPTTFLGGLTKRMARVNLGELIVRKGRSGLDFFDKDGIIMRRLTFESPATWAVISSFQSSFRSEVHKLALPTLVIWGHDDPIFSLDSACLLKESIPNATLYVVDGAGHEPQISHPQRTAAYVEQFLARVRSTPATKGDNPSGVKRQ